VVAALVRNGRLVYEFPEQPNHPRQRYRATQRESDPRSDA
jgi:hypothetical protein